MTRRTLRCALMLAVLFGCNGEADGAPASVRLTRVLGGASFAAPVWALPAPDDANAWYVVLQAGQVLRFASLEASTSQLAADIVNRVESGPSEAGLLGMTFHPRYPEVRDVFLSYTARGPKLISRVSRFPVTDAGIDVNAEQVVLAVEQPYSNHNGGHILFGPDGFLYFGLGDGGSAGDPHNNGQNTASLLGKMLRLDVTSGTAPYAIPTDNPFAAGGGAREVFAWGLRNPWRWSFDSLTGKLWVGDVGQNVWEEIDVVDKGKNYGWRVREGRHCYQPRTGCKTAGLVDPVLEYSHDNGDISVTGGYVYRGKAVAALKEQYVFADYVSGRIFAAPLQGPDSAGALRVVLDSDLAISSFAEGKDGELFVVDHRGGLYRLDPL